jgi:protein O-GlcNAc transferase
MRLLAPLSLSLAVLFAPACGQPEIESPQVESPPVPEPDMTDMEPQVEKLIRERRAAVQADPQSAEAWGRLGMVFQAHGLWEEAVLAHQRAQELDPTEVRWPYFLGDVLIILGTDLEAAEQAFRRALELRPGYAPTHMRLGSVLLARDQVEEAAVELERALDLQPDLQPARVTLAQVQLSQGKVAVSKQLLAQVLEAAPRHAQALSTLGQVYMRQGRREEAREIALRARSAATYNLYTDPLMGEVDSESRSAVVLWERARAFLDNGNYEQAARGLRLVVGLQPWNADAHHQLAISYGNLGDLERSRHHLEQAVMWDPEYPAPRIRLATVYLDQQNPTAAVEQLRRALELAPDDRDAGWLLGKAQLSAGDLRGALASFAQAKARADAVPTWARNEWGSALAQAGQPDAALAQFRAALAADPDNAQALFYTGLLHEGLGRMEEALASYCRAMSAAPNPPAAARLDALGHDCG